MRVKNLVYCGDCSHPTRIEARYRICDTCRTRTKLKGQKPKKKLFGPLLVEACWEEFWRRRKEMGDEDFATIYPKEFEVMSGG